VVLRDSQVKQLSVLKQELRHDSQNDRTIAHYKRNLREIFDEGFNNCYPLDINHIKLTKSYTDWKFECVSSILLVTGETEEHQEMNFWLSPALVDLSSDNIQTGDLVLQFFCRPCQCASLPKTDDILGDLIYQLLKAKPLLLRRWSIQTILKEQKHEAAEPDIAPPLRSLLKG
jgi:hypothetical protein